MTEERLRRVVEGRVPGLFYLIAIFSLIEFGILVLCGALSIDQNHVKIFDPKEEVIYEGIYNPKNISEFKNMYGIENFKAEGYAVVYSKVEKKFPTRTWASLSVCVPLVLIFFVVFLIRIFEDVFGKKKSKVGREENQKSGDEVFEETRFEKLFSTLGRLNIYSLGAVVLLSAIFFWVVPDLLVAVGQISFKTIIELKWVLLAVVLLGGVYLILRSVFAYKTRKEMIRQQADIQKHRDRLTMASSLEKKFLEDKSIEPPE